MSESKVYRAGEINNHVFNLLAKMVTERAGYADIYPGQRTMFLTVNGEESEVCRLSSKEYGDATTCLEIMVGIYSSNEDRGRLCVQMGDMKHVFFVERTRVIAGKHFSLRPPMANARYVGPSNHPKR